MNFQKHVTPQCFISNQQFLDNLFMLRILCITEKTCRNCSGSILSSLFVLIHCTFEVAIFKNSPYLWSIEYTFVQLHFNQPWKYVFFSIYNGFLDNILLSKNSFSRYLRKDVLVSACSKFHCFNREPRS